MHLKNIYKRNLNDSKCFIGIVKQSKFRHTLKGQFLVQNENYIIMIQAFILKKDFAEC